MFKTHWIQIGFASPHPVNFTLSGACVVLKICLLRNCWGLCNNFLNSVAWWQKYLCFCLFGIARVYMRCSSLAAMKQTVKMVQSFWPLWNSASSKSFS